MSWFGQDKKSVSASVEVLLGSPGDMIPCKDPMTAIVVLPPDPEPDLSTKPKDVVGFCFGYACPKKHVFGIFDSIRVEDYKIRKVCSVCGGVAKPSVVKRTAEPQWGNCALHDLIDLRPSPDWKWYNCYMTYIGKTYRAYESIGDTLWTKYEFVHYLDTPKKTTPGRKK